MKYYKSSKSKISYRYLFAFLIIMIGSIYLLRAPAYRSIVTVNLGSLKVDYLNTKALFLNFINGGELETVSINLSPNNFVRIQNERSSMVNQFIVDGSTWPGQNKYYKANFIYNDLSVDSEVKLFGMNSDHFRNPNSHSFRIRFDGLKDFGNKTQNFLNPRSRNFITDPLLNIIYKKLYDGIQIDYKPYNVIFNKINFGIFYSEDFFDKYLIEENDRRESVIFEIIQDSIDYNYIGEEESLVNLSNELNILYKNDYNQFIEKVDLQKLKAVIKLSLIANSAHGLEDINLHWYYNPVTDQIEPTIREVWTYPISENFVLNEPSISSFEIENRVINDLMNQKLEYEIFSELLNEIESIRDIIINDNDYKELKSKMIGFEKKVLSREKTILNNLELLQKISLNKSEKYEPGDDLELIEIKNDTLIKGEFEIHKNQKLIVHKNVNIYLDQAYLKIAGAFEANGSFDEPITIQGLNNKGTIFFRTKDKIEIKNVIFKNLTNLQSGFLQPASITFYECEDINIEDSKFIDNDNGDDYVNFFRSSNIIINNSTFENVLNDAVDSDFSIIEINNSKFNKIGNDAIDGSGSNIRIF